MYSTVRGNTLLSGAIVLAWLSWRNYLGSISLSYFIRRGVRHGTRRGVFLTPPPPRQPPSASALRRFSDNIGPRTFPRTHFSPATQTNAGEREGKGNRKCIALPGEILYYSPCSPDPPGLWEKNEWLKRCLSVIQVAVCNSCVSSFQWILGSSLPFSTLRTRSSYEFLC